MSSVDEMLQVKLREIVDVPAPPADKAEQDVLRRVARRRRRRRVVSGGAVVCAVLAVGGALVVAQRADDGVATVAGTTGADGTATQADSINALTSVRVQRTGLGGGEKIVFTFAEALPTEPARSLPGIGSVRPDPAGVVYTTQGADEIHICESRHFGYEPYPSLGSVDVFIPATWTAPGFDPSGLAIDMVVPTDSPEPTAPLGKIVGCGPYQGYVQYSILGPPSNVLENVSVVTESNQLVLEIRP
jgi:hypothetical protein